MEFIDLYELQKQMREGLEDLFPDSVWVRAEISSIQVKANGHCYMELSQSSDGAVVAKARAVIWRGRYLPISTYFRQATDSDMAPGMQILCRVQVTYPELYGLTLTIDEVEPQFTLGQAELLRRQTVERLRENALMDAQKTLGVAPIPFNLAVISARDAAGYGDFCRHLQQNPYGFRFGVELFESAMQGTLAPSSVSRAIEDIQTCGRRYDAILIIRGGGSNLDLACFDDYDLCFAIANSSIPVFTAIGHDRDLHVADMVAFRFEKTPTALADFFIGMFLDEDERITSIAARLNLLVSARISSLEARLDILEARIKAADPRNVLSRGYSLVTDSRGVVVKSSGKLSDGDEIMIMFEDGQVRAIVKG